MANQAAAYRALADAMGEGAARFACRWTVKGLDTNGLPCTCIFDVARDHRHVIAYPASVQTWASAFDLDALTALRDAADAGEACTIPVAHPVFGQRTLVLCPLPGAVRLCQTLPKHPIEITFRGEAHVALRDTLTEIHAYLQEKPSLPCKPALRSCYPWPSRSLWGG
jgi:hypothetical protein